MRKLLISLLAISGATAFAMDNSQFQAFDNEVNIGVGSVQTTSNTDKALPGGGNQIGTQTMVNLEAERLFNNGIWVDLNANMAFGSGAGNAIENTNGSNYGFNGKVGYAFPLLNQHLQLTPYALVGINNNGATDGLGAVQTTTGFADNQFSYTAGAGGRLEYRINHIFLVYADQLVAYNMDQTSYAPGIAAQDNLQMTSTLGAKFNIVDDLQLGVKGFYSYYQPNGSANGPLFNLAQEQSGVGGMVTIGMTY